MTYTLSQLATAVAGTNDPARIKTVTRRIEHWYALGNLFDLAGIDMAERHQKRLGRGRVRRYSDDALTWCRLWNALADMGVGTHDMGGAVTAIGLARRDNKQLIDDALRGEGPTAFLVSEHVPVAPEGPTQVNCTVSHSPIELGDEWRIGWFINLTAIFKQ